MEPQGRRHPAPNQPRFKERDRVLTVPNALSALRLLLVPVFLWLLLVEHADAWATGILIDSM